MISASCLEVAMLALLMAHHDGTRLAGFIAWALYFRYSASRCALERVAQWLHDRSGGPPGGPA